MREGFLGRVFFVCSESLEGLEQTFECMYLSEFCSHDIENLGFCSLSLELSILVSKIEFGVT